MKRSLIVRFEAEKEIKEAYQWYEERSRGLGSNFLLAVDTALATIQRNPDQYPLVYRNIRRVLIRRFPYGIYYIVSDKVISVLAIFHAQRNPIQWMQRK